ncbi:transketolase family protein [Solirubrobacter deserti]|uniref:Transketolase family protein n=1 Tax=Solirubrobacter deserti TaxID=2282478 RepID=A0ABT4RJU0_9ACTN|nr:transketolase family protein [Solirubrobacter deserti]MDA0138824.1 transketolase family protein [Solirubrobacter deserti]
MSERYDCREAFQRTLVDLATRDERIVAVVNDSVGSSKLGAFEQAFPDRLINVGIAEQNMVGVGAGLANGGRIPFVSGAAPFLTGRALEQIKADVAYSNTNVKLCGQSPGMAYGELGPTHHSIEDLAWLRAIANLPVIVPVDPIETEAVIRWAAATEGPVFIRIGRVPVPNVNEPGYTFALGRATTLRDGADIAIIACGTMVERALEAATFLAARGVEARVLNMPTVRPLDREAVVRAAVETGAIVTVEEHTIHGGLGGAIAEVVATEAPVPMRLMGVPGVFAPTGSALALFRRFGLTAAGIAESALLLRRAAA